MHDDKLSNGCDGYRVWSGISDYQEQKMTDFLQRQTILGDFWPIRMGILKELVNRYDILVMV